MDETAIKALPLSNRNYTQILGLSPGVIVDLPNAAQLGRGTQNVASNGATPTANNIQFNGIDANNLAENSAANSNEEVGTAIPTRFDSGISSANGELRCGRTAAEPALLPGLELCLPDSAISPCSLESQGWRSLLQCCSGS